jgi:hypothetical protein
LAFKLFVAAVFATASAIVTVSSLQASAVDQVVLVLFGLLALMLLRSRG